MAFRGVSFPVVLYTALAVLSSVIITGSSADSCNPSPCLHGSCYQGPISLYKCVCHQGWIGDDCDQIAASTPGPCSPNPCLHGTCMSQGTNFTCTACQSGFTGPNCNQVVTSPDPCKPDPCVHGSCISNGSTSYCQCSQGYTGTTCATVTASVVTSPDPCKPDPCVHGSCFSSGSTSYCQCSQGYTGTTCATVTPSVVTSPDPCKPDPCVHGSCFSSGSTSYCQCSQGYTGTTCATGTDPCSSNPCVNGVCYHSNNDFTCVCSKGFIGKTCSQKADQCSSSPCVHGTCFSGPNSHVCQCDPNYTGTNCDQHMDACSSHPCVHGMCSLSSSGYVCSCLSGFTGLNCDTPIGPCDSSPCRHGSCLSNGHDYVCQCQTGWTGKDCDVYMPTDPCYANPCVHGLCFSSSSSYFCKCPAGFTGQNCDQPDNPCIPDPCNGHGNCARSSGGSGYACTCFYGYTGLTCAAGFGGPGILSPGDCVVSPWGQWSAVAGFGSQDRQRVVVKQPSPGGKQCPPLSESRHTNQSCGPNCQATNLVSNFMTPTGLGSTGYGKLRDLLIILDSSGSIGPSDFDNAKTQLSRLVGMFCPTPDPFAGDHQKAALLVFDHGVDEIFDFDDMHDTNEVQAKIRSVFYHGGGTRTDFALEYARTHMLTATKGMRFRADVTQEILLITDGLSNVPAETLKEAYQLQQYAKVYALAIGVRTPDGQNEITNCASSPPSRHIFSIPGFDDLKTLVDEIQRQLQNTQCARFQY
ncbi:fibropellin-1-like isoform X6 [Mya arenaria]|uniref:fibropellin-1-like isoform X6 n=1 Tax=Mya arenaria TaxID=6604 RepID=UPI0022E8BB96|nr:fibropellin-1-like isoform X6 [Mya arenaria]